MKAAESASSKQGLTDGTLSEFIPSIKTAKNADFSDEYTI